MPKKLDHLKTLLLTHELERHTATFPSAPERESAQAAAKAKHDPVTDPENYLTERAKHLLSGWRSLHPEEALKAEQNDFFRQLRLFFLPIALLGAIAGFFLYQLDTKSQVNLLSVPLLGLMAWSFLACTVSLAFWIISFFRTEKTPLTQTLIASLHHWFSRFLIKGSDNHCLTSFHDKWWQTLAFPLRCRLRSALHLLAVAVAFGSIIGLYTRGISTEYRVVWESTFFQNGEEMRAFLAPIFQPAIWLLGDSFPAAESLDALQRTSQSRSTGENAERWIHWYAMTVAILLGLPRLLLALLWRLRSAQAESALTFRSLPVDGWEKILYEATPVTQTLYCVAYPSSPDSDEVSALDGFASQELERKVQIKIVKTIPFGEEEKTLDLGCSVDYILFPLSATPEQESHGAVYHTISQQHTGVQVLLHAKGFDTKNAHLRDAEDRRLTRLRAWHKLFSDKGVKILTPAPTAPTLSR